MYLVGYYYYPYSLPWGLSPCRPKKVVKVFNMDKAADKEYSGLLGNRTNSLT